MGIGIGITTYNRSELLSNILPIWINRSPKETKIVVHVDGDASKYNEWSGEYPEVLFICTGERVGIAKAKNRCMEALSSCDYVFMADDDIYPKCDDWVDPFLSSVFTHLCYITLNQGGGEVKFEGVNECFYSGCGGMLLYFTGRAKSERYLEEFGLYGYEHVEITERINKRHPTPYISPKGIHGKFYSFDFPDGDPEFELREFKSSIHSEDIESYLKVSSQLKQKIDNYGT